MRRFLTVLLFSAIGAGAQAQRLDPGDYIYPIRDVARLYSANFGEMRPGHFHAGIDIKTDGAEGKPLVAVADGYVSRVSLAAGGYGRAVYLTLRNGTTAVYGHLQRFRDDIEEHVRQERTARRANGVNLFFGPGTWPVKQGDVIGFSGDSGSSMGPHLHFEIRDTPTQRLYNVVREGVIRPEDDLPPRIMRLHYVEVDTLQGVPVRSRMESYAVVRSAGGNYRLTREEPVGAGRKGYFVAEVTDRRNGVHNTFGIWRVTASVDGVPYFEYRMDGFTHDLSRCCDAVSCYSLQPASRNEVIRLTRLDGCIDDFYPVLKNQALLTPSEGQSQQIRIEAEDDSGNRSILEFRTIRQPAQRDFRAVCDSTALIVDNRRPFSHTAGEASVHIPAGVFYEPLFFSQSSRPAQFAAAPSVAVLSPLYSILDYDTPLHTAATVTIRAYVPQNLQPHTTLGFVRKGKVSYAGGKYKNGAVTLSTRTLGDFCVVADTVPPRIEPRFKAGEPIRTRSITFRLRDNFSGIGSYTATLDGEWILLERNPMQGTITHTFDDSRT